MDSKIKGIVPVMLTPFDDQGAIDWGGLEALIHWYIDHGAEALFAVCQSSEMQHLSLSERRDLARFTITGWWEECQSSLQVTSLMQLTTKSPN